jgi:ABC-type nitrate/sulfonate/bicarbonate transport system substrate-binding protein
MRWKRGLGLGLIAALLAGCASGGASHPANERPPGSAPGSAATAEERRQPTEKVVFALPSVAGSYAPHHVALHKGLFREEGLDVELPVTRSNLIAAGLTAGEIDYSGSVSPSVRHALTGMPVRVVATTTRATRQVVVAPGIQSMEQLRGQTVAVGVIGDGPYNSGVIAFEYFGIDPQEVTWIGAGGISERIVAVHQGAAQALIIGSSEVPGAQAAGLIPLLRLSEIAPLPEGGVSVSVAKLETQRGQVKRLLRAMLRATQYLKSDRDGSLPVMMQYLSLSRETAEQIYAAITPDFIDDDTISERSLRFTIESEKQQLGLTDDVSFNQVVDFGPLYEALAELGITPAADSVR